MKGSSESKRFAGLTKKTSCGEALCPEAPAGELARADRCRLWRNPSSWDDVAEPGNYAALCAAVGRALRDGQDPPVSGSQTVTVLEVIESARAYAAVHR